MPFDDDEVAVAFVGCDPKAFWKSGNPPVAEAEVEVEVVEEMMVEEVLVEEVWVVEVVEVVVEVVVAAIRTTK